MALVERPRVFRVTRKIYSALTSARMSSVVARLERRNLNSTSSILGSGEAVVSMTTYGERIANVFLTIEAIASGSVRPRRMVLWLDDEAVFDDLPESLRRLQTRGLEVCLSKNYGPHTKYFPSLLDDKAGRDLLVTADDDIVYPRYWLRMLVRASSRNGSGVTCYRAHRLHLSPDGVVAPYATWKECWSNRPSFLNFPTGVSGAAYSASFMDCVRQKGELFLDCCPKNDDLWLHKVAIENGYRVAQVFDIPLEFPVLPGSQKSGLFHQNVLGGSNDNQISATYSDADLLRLQSCARELGSWVERGDQAR